MAQDVRHVNLSDLQEVPAWKQLVEEVRATKRPAVIRADGEDVAEIRPAPPKLPRKARTNRGLHQGDALEQLIGMVDLTETDLAEHHDAYLADAYADTHR